LRTLECAPKALTFDVENRSTMEGTAVPQVVSPLASSSLSPSVSLMKRTKSSRLGSIQTVAVVKFIDSTDRRAKGGEWGSVNRE
jgi:hypothetical protein